MAKPCLITLLIIIVGSCFAQTQSKPEPTESTAGPGGAIVYADGGGFLISPPKGWILDREAGQKIGTCCVFYPEGSTFNGALSVIYPSIVSKSANQATLQQFMVEDLGDFRDHNPGMTYEDVEGMKLKRGKTAKLRYFWGVNAASSEAVAYIDEQNVIAMVVLSSKTRQGMTEALPLLQEVLNSYSYMNVKIDHNAASESGVSLPKN